MPLGGDIILASDWADLVVPPPRAMYEPTNQNALTNAGQSAGSPVCGVAFTAPPSGRVLVHVSAQLIQTAGTGSPYTYAGGFVRAGATLATGATVHDPSVGEPMGRVSCGGATLSAGVGAGASTIHEGLTPGSPYNVVVVTWVQGGTGGTYTVITRGVLAVPLPFTT